MGRKILKKKNSSMMLIGKRSLDRQGGRLRKRERNASRWKKIREEWKMRSMYHEAMSLCLSRNIISSRKLRDRGDRQRREKNRSMIDIEWRKSRELMRREKNK